MLTLHRKLWRDLGDMKGQVAAIAVVIAAGEMTLIIAASSLDSIRFSKERFYTSHEFADLFVSLTRARITFRPAWPTSPAWPAPKPGWSRRCAWPWMAMSGPFAG